jgi:hypothetical protein
MILIMAPTRAKRYNDSVKTHWGLYALATVAVLLSLGARHTVSPPSARSFLESDRITIGTTPGMPPGWKKLELAAAHPISNLPGTPPDSSIPPEFVAAPPFSRQPQDPAMSYAPPTAQSSRSANQQGGLSFGSPNKPDLPLVVSPLEPAGWLMDNIRELDASRPKVTKDSSRASSDGLFPMLTPGTEQGTENALDWQMPDSGVKNDVFAPRKPTKSSRGIRNL